MRADRQLAYITEDRTIWLVNSDGSEREVIARDVCSNGGQGQPGSSPIWSLQGDKLAVRCMHPDGAYLIVLDMSGHQIASATAQPPSDIRVFVWAPDGNRIAYGTWPVFELRLLDLTTGEDTRLVDQAWPLSWPFTDRLVAGLNAVQYDVAIMYDAHWLDLDSGQVEPAPALNRTHWFSTDGSKAVVVDRPSSQQDGRLTLAIYDLATGEERTVSGSTIGFRGEGIPSHLLAVSQDGTRFYWADAGTLPAVIYRADMDGSNLTQLTTVPTFQVALSGDGLVAYVRLDPSGSTSTLVVEDLEMGTRVELGDQPFTMDWRPASAE